jgi:hypothetical protein
MTIVFIGQINGCQRIVIHGDEGIWDPTIHISASLTELFDFQFGLISLAIPDPFLKDSFAPSRCKMTFRGQPHQQIAQWSGIEDTGIEDDNWHVQRIDCHNKYISKQEGYNF